MPGKSPLGYNGEMDEPSGKDKFDQFVHDLGHSGLVASLDETIRAFHERPRDQDNSQDDRTNLGGWLIGQNVLTYWQFTKLCNGQWRDFFLDEYKLLDHLAVGEAHSYYLAEKTEKGGRVALRITPRARSKTPYKTEYVVVAEFA